MRRPSDRAFLLAGLLVALVLAGVVSFYASSAPDGLDRVAGDHGMASTEREHLAGEGPLAGYRARGVENERLATAVAGIGGALVVLTLFGGLTLLLRRRAATSDPDPDLESDREPLSGRP